MLIKNLISGEKTRLADKRGKVSIDIILNACEHVIIDLTELRIWKLLNRRKIFQANCTFDLTSQKN